MGAAIKATKADMDKKRIAAELVALAPYITSNDRMEIAIQQKCHLRTIDRYLGGDVRKIPFGETLLVVVKNFLKESRNAATA